MDLFTYVLVVAMCNDTKCTEQTLAIAVSKENCARMLDVYVEDIVSINGYENTLICRPFVTSTAKKKGTRT